MITRRIVVLAVGLAVASASCGEPAGEAGTAPPAPSTVATTTTSTPPTTLPPTTTTPATVPTPTTITIGDPSLVVVPTESGEVPLDLEVGCPGGPTFPVSALQEMEPLVGSGREQIEAAVAMFLDSGEGTAWPPADQWQVLHETGDEVLLVHVDAAAASIGFQSVVLVEGAWRWSGSQMGGDCLLEARLPGRLNRVQWRIDPTATAGPESTTLHLLATERECASGAPMGDRLRSPSVVITAAEVRITLAADPPAGDYQSCPSNPEQAVTIDLGVPIGDRTVVDGLTVLGSLIDLIG